MSSTSYEFKRGDLLRHTHARNGPWRGLRSFEESNGHFYKTRTPDGALVAPESSVLYERTYLSVEDLEVLHKHGVRLALKTTDAWEIRSALIGKKSLSQAENFMFSCKDVALAIDDFQYGMVKVSARGVQQLPIDPRALTIWQDPPLTNVAWDTRQKLVPLRDWNRLCRVLGSAYTGSKDVIKAAERAEAHVERLLEDVETYKAAAKYSSRQSRSVPVALVRDVAKVREVLGAFEGESLADAASRLLRSRGEARSDLACWKADAAEQRKRAQVAEKAAHDALDQLNALKAARKAEASDPRDKLLGKKVRHQLGGPVMVVYEKLGTDGVRAATSWEGEPVDLSTYELEPALDAPRASRWPVVVAVALPILIAAVAQVVLL